MGEGVSSGSNWGHWLSDGRPGFSYSGSSNTTRMLGGAIARSRRSFEARSTVFSVRQRATENRVAEELILTKGSADAEK
jgi:hypothetical protein